MIVDFIVYDTITDKTLEEKNMLTIQNVTKQYGNKIALDEVNLTFENGVTGLLGPNGAGKSTLMRILATLDRPTKGIVSFQGQDITKKPNELRRILGYLPQDFGVYPNMNAYEFLEYMAAMKGLTMKTARKRIKDLLDVLNLGDTGKKHLSDFSGGMKQRVGIAQAMLNDPKILIVDEPTVGLDPEERIGFRNLLASLAAKRIIILSTHIVSDVESIAPKIVVMKKGKLLADTTPEQIIRESEGNVWNVVVPVEKLEYMQQKFAVSNAMQRADGIHMRIVSGSKPCLNAVYAEPTLEDGYLRITASKEEA